MILYCSLQTFALHLTSSLTFDPIPLHNFLRGIFRIFFLFYVRYSTLLHLPPLKFHCVGGCWDGTQDYIATLALTARRSKHSSTELAWFRPHSDRSNPHSAKSYPHTDWTHPHSARSHPHSARSNPHSAKSHPHSARSHLHSARSNPHSAKSHPHSLDLIHTEMTFRFTYHKP